LKLFPHHINEPEPDELEVLELSEQFFLKLFPHHINEPELEVVEEELAA
jgi:hypothetical protein